MSHKPIDLRTARQMERAVKTIEKLLRNHRLIRMLAAQGAVISRANLRWMKSELYQYRLRREGK